MKTIINSIIFFFILCVSSNVFAISLTLDPSNSSIQAGTELNLISEKTQLDRSQVDVGWHSLDSTFNSFAYSDCVYTFYKKKPQDSSFTQMGSPSGNNIYKFYTSNLDVGKWEFKAKEVCSQYTYQACSEYKSSTIMSSQADGSTDGGSSWYWATRCNTKTGNVPISNETSNHSFINIYPPAISSLNLVITPNNKIRLNTSIQIKANTTGGTDTKVYSYYIKNTKDLEYTLLTTSYSDTYTLFLDPKVYIPANYQIKVKVESSNLITGYYKEAKSSVIEFLTDEVQSEIIKYGSNSKQLKIQLYETKNPNITKTHYLSMSYIGETIPKYNRVTITYDNLSMIITCNGKKYPIAKTSDREALQNYVSCTIDEGRTSITADLELYEQFSYDNIYTEKPSNIFDDLSHTSKDTPRCLSEDNIGLPAKICKWQEALNDTQWLVFSQFEIKEIKLGTKANIEKIEDTACFDDANNNSVIEQSEMGTCVKTDDNTADFCTLNAKKCTESHSQPYCYGNGVFNSSTNKCEIKGKCINGHYNSTTDRCETSRTYKCSKNNYEYSSQSSCTSNCKTYHNCSTKYSCKNKSIFSVKCGNGSQRTSSISCTSSDKANITIDDCIGKRTFYNVNLFNTNPISIGGGCNNQTLVWTGSYLKLTTPNRWWGDCSHSGIINTYYYSLNQSYICSLDNKSYSYYNSCYNDCQTSHSCYEFCPADYTKQNDNCFKDVYCDNQEAGYTHKKGSFVCEAEPLCNETEKDEIFKNGKCIKTTCPYGSKYPCYSVNGSNFCNILNCQKDISTSIATSNDNNNDIIGTDVSDAEECTGTIMLFNGSTHRCRTAGVTTANRSCCSKSSYLFGLNDCKAEEQQLAQKRSKGFCHYIGRHVTKKLKLPLGGSMVLERQETYCCFNSKLARIIHQQGRQQVTNPILNWGSSPSPNCSGFTQDQFRSLDFSKIDFAEFENDLTAQFNANNTADKFQSKLSNTNTNSTNQTINKQGSTSSEVQKAIENFYE